MAKNGFGDLIKMIDSMADNTDEIIVSNLQKTNDELIVPYMNNIERHTRTGQTLEDVNRHGLIETSYDGKTKLYFGHDFNTHTESALRVIYLMHGTPRQAPDLKFKRDIHGKTSKVFDSNIRLALAEIMSGKQSGG